MNSFKFNWDNHFTLLWWMFLSYRNKSIDFLAKLIDWFLYDKDFRYERVNDPYTFNKGPTFKIFLPQGQQTINMDLGMLLRLKNFQLQ